MFGGRGIGPIGGGCVEPGPIGGGWDPDGLTPAGGVAGRFGGADGRIGGAAVVGDEGRAVADSGGVPVGAIIGRFGSAIVRPFGSTPSTYGWPSAVVAASAMLGPASIVGRFAASV